MRHATRVLWMVAAVVLSVSTTDSSAQDRGGGGGGFWERMSGPGKWTYISAYISPCLVGEKRRGFCRTGNGDVWFNIGASYASAGEVTEPGVLVSPSLRQWSLEPSLDIRLHTLGERRRTPLYFGIGMGFHHFWGEGVSLNRPSVEARLGFIYPVGERFGLGVRYSHRVFLGGFDAEDFGDPIGDFATEGNDGLHTIFFHVTF